MVKKKSSSSKQASALAREVNAALDTKIMLGNDPYFRIDRIPTGSLILDRITGGGFALGRHVELFGDYSACKSYIAYKTMALAQERGKTCALIDCEHSFNPEWFNHLGGKSDSLLTFHPEKAEDAIAAMMIFAKNREENLVEVITLDSISSLVPTEEMERDPREEDRLGSQARMMSRALRRLTAVNKKTLFIWVNQERMNIGIKFGNPRTTSGGRALRFYATTRVEMRRGTKVIGKRKIAKAGKLVESEVEVGRWIQVKVEKDKSTIPLREGSFIFDSEGGYVDIASEIVQLGLEDKLIDRVGNSFIYVDLDEKEWRGTEKVFFKYLRDEDILRRELVDVIADKTNQLPQWE